MKIEYIKSLSTYLSLSGDWRDEGHALHLLMDDFGLSTEECRKVLDYHIYKTLPKVYRKVTDFPGRFVAPGIYHVDKGIYRIEGSVVMPKRCKEIDFTDSLLLSWSGKGMIYSEWEDNSRSTIRKGTFAGVRIGYPIIKSKRNERVHRILHRFKRKLGHLSQRTNSSNRPVRYKPSERSKRSLR